MSTETTPQQEIKIDIDCHDIKSGSLFHTFKETESILIPESNPRTFNCKAIVSGFHKGEIKEGSTIKVQPGMIYTGEVIKVIERRDHKCIFSKPGKGKDAFFKVEIKYQRL